MKGCRLIYIITTFLLLFSFFSYGQNGQLKKVSLTEGLSVCASDSFNSYELTIEWAPRPMPSADNVYTVELSDAQGDFSNPVVLDRITGENAKPKFTHNLRFPENIRGEGYRIRVRSSSPFSEKVTEPFPAYYINVKKHLILNDKITEVVLCPGETKILKVDETDLPKGLLYRWRKYKDDEDDKGVLLAGVSGSSCVVSQVGIYQVEVDYGDGYCTRSADTKSNKVAVTVQGQTDLKLNEGILQKYICKGEDFKLVASKKNASLTYSWYREDNDNPIASGVGMYTYTTPKGDGAAGRYYVKVGDSNSTCQERSNTVEVKIRGDKFKVDIEIEDGLDFVLPGVVKKLLVSSVVGAENPTYQWYEDRSKNGNYVKIEGATGREYNTKFAGRYKVKVTDSGKCVSEEESNILELNYPIEFKGRIGYKSYYPPMGCKTNKVVLGLIELKAVVTNGKEVLVPSSNYGDLDYKWEKDGVVVNGETNYDIELDNPLQNGEYSLSISRLTSGIQNVKSQNSLPVKLAGLNNDVVLKASYTPSDGGGVVHLCRGFVEELKVEGSVPLSSTYVWYKDDVKIDDAVGNTYIATKEGSYRVEIYGANGCPIVTNSLLLKIISIKVDYLNDFKYFTNNNAPVVLFLPYKEVKLRTSITGIDPSKAEVSWYKVGSKDKISNANSNEFVVSSAGAYFCKVTSKQGCASEIFSKTVWVVSPKEYKLEIDYLSGKEACNDAQDVVLELTSLKGLVEAGGDDIEVVIPKEEYNNYQFQWYKGDDKLDGQVSTTLTVPAEASPISNYFLYITYDGKVIKSNPKQVGVEKLDPKIELENSNSYYSLQDNEVFICQGENVVLKAKIKTNNTVVVPYTYQWYKGFNPIAGAESDTYSVTEEGSYRVKVSGSVCRKITSPTYDVKFFSKDQVKFYLNGSDEVLDLSKKISFITGESVKIRVEGAKGYLGLSENGMSDGIDTNNNIITIRKGGKFKIKVDIGKDNCAVFFDVDVEEIPLPSEIPTVVTPNGANNRYWNLPSKYMQKKNVRVSIYTQDGVKVLSTTNFQNDTWPESSNLESKGRALIYLYIIEVDGKVEKRGTITLFQ